MRKAFIISIIATIVLFILQGLWINNTYRNYTQKSLTSIEDITFDPIEKELSTRSYLQHLQFTPLKNR